MEKMGSRFLSKRHILCMCRFTHIQRGCATTSDNRSTSLSDLFTKATQGLVESKPVKPSSLCRTQEADPRNHTAKQLGLYYTVDKEDHKRFFPLSINRYMLDQSKTFQELSLMVRKPALEIFSIIELWNLENPMLKFIICGKRGSGKTMTLAHTIHYCGKKDFLILHVPHMAYWLLLHRQAVESKTVPGFYNVPSYAVNFLSYFKTMNESFINTLKTTKSYTWTQKDTTEEGSLLSELVDFGIHRVKYADDVCRALYEELKVHAEADRVKILLAVDGVNAIWKEAPYKVPFSPKILLPGDKISLVYYLKEFISSNIKNCISVFTVNEEVNYKIHRENYTPKYLLGKEGFNFMDPFIPIEVEHYTDKEAHSCLNYYIDNHWIQNRAAKTDEGKKQIMFLTNKNPHAIMEFCASR